MPRGDGIAEEAIGKADFAAALAKARIVDEGLATVEFRASSEGREAVVVRAEATTFRILGLGMDRTRFFATDALERLGVFGLVVGTVEPGEALPRANRRDTLQEAQLEAAKFILRLTDEERARIEGERSGEEAERALREEESFLADGLLEAGRGGRP